MAGRSTRPLGAKPENRVPTVSNERNSGAHFPVIENDGVFSKIGFLVLLIFVFCSACRVFDFVLRGLHLPMILSVVAACFTLLGGGLRTALQTRVGKLMALFTVWIVVCIPFSTWRGGSFGVLTDTWSKSFLVFLMVAGAATSLERVRRMMVTVGFGALGAGVLALILGYRSYGRLSLPNGYLSNANDFAQVLLVGLCFLPVLLAGSTSRIRRLIVLLGIVFFAYLIVATGSRAALLTAMLVGVLATLRVNFMKKVLLLAAFALMGIGVFLFAPGTARDRLATLLGGDKDEMTSLQQVAVDSAEGRKNVLMDSIVLTLRNPLFGVGPGQFQTSAADYKHEQGKRATWLETHNAYTQVSSETGIPGFLIFAAAVATCLFRLGRLRKAVRGNPREHARLDVLNHLWLGFTAFAVTSFFSSVAYQFYFSLLLGLCAAATAAAERELKIGAPINSAAGAPLGVSGAKPPKATYVSTRG